MTFKERATSLALWLITAVGGYLVSEQVISGEQLIEVQGIVGMALSGGGFTLITLLYTVRVLLPKKAVENLVDKVGQDKVDNFFVQLDEATNLLKETLQEVKKTNEELTVLREEKEALKTELGL